MQKIWLAGGCFWGVEVYFKQLNGILSTKVGYAQGSVQNPSYEEVCTGKTGHTETLEIEFDSKIVSIEAILKEYFKIIDPFTLNKQGNDIGSQYRTGIYYENDSLKKEVDNFIINEQKKYETNFVIEIDYLKNFYAAEEYHQDYLKKNPNGYCHINLNLINEK